MHRYGNLVSFLTMDLTATRCLFLQEIQIDFGFTFLVPAHSGSPGQNPQSHKTVVVVVVIVTVEEFF